MNTLFRYIPVSLALGAGIPCTAQTYYRYADLGDLTSGGDTWGTSLNSSGTAVGYSLYDTASRLMTGVATTPGGLRDVGRLVGGNWAWAWDLNDAGRIVGVSYYRSGFINGPYGYVTNAGGALVILGQFDTALVTGAYAINSAGTVVGFGTPKGVANLNTFHACRWSASAPTAVPTDLGTLGGVNSFAYDVNDSGAVVGAAELSAGPFHACLWQGSTKTDLGTLGGRASEAWGINNAGQIVGWANRPDGARRAFLHEGTAMTDLGALGESSEARAINTGGVVVGSSWVTDQGPRAFVKHPGRPMLNLNDRTPNRPAGVVLQYAMKLNDSGVIVGYGRHAGRMRGFTLTPGICAADFNADGFVTGEDFDAFVSAYAAGEPLADFNGSGFVNADDFDQYVAVFEMGC